MLHVTPPAQIPAPEEKKPEPKTRDQLSMTTFGSSRLLDRVPTTKFEALILEFQRLGGVIRPGITITFHKETKDWTVPKDTTISMNIGTHIFPVCQAGENRSQITRMALEQIKKGFPQLGVTIYNPHGAEGGVDPFIRPTMTPDQLAAAGDAVDWDREMAYQYYPVAVEPMFAAELGAPRVHRVLENECINHLQLIHESDSPVPPNGRALLQKRDPRPMGTARDFMTDNYFHDLVIKKKGHIIAFNRAVHVMMMRLVEVAHLKKTNLAGVVLQPLDSMDPIVMKSVTLFARCFHGMLRPMLPAHMHSPPIPSSAPVLSAPATATATARPILTPAVTVSAIVIPPTSVASGPAEVKLKRSRSSMDIVQAAIDSLDPKSPLHKEVVREVLGHIKQLQKMKTASGGQDYYEMMYQQYVDALAKIITKNSNDAVAAFNEVAVDLADIDNSVLLEFIGAAINTSMDAHTQNMKKQQAMKEEMVSILSGIKRSVTASIAQSGLFSKDGRCPSFISNIGLALITIDSKETTPEMAARIFNNVQIIINKVTAEKLKKYSPARCDLYASVKRKLDATAIKYADLLTPPGAPAPAAPPARESKSAAAPASPAAPPAKRDKAAAGPARLR